MYEYKYIDKKTHDKAVANKITIQPPKTLIKAPHFVFYVKSQLEKVYGAQQVEEGGLHVYTTLDLPTQEDAEKTVREELDKIQYLNVTNGAALVTRPPTGEILAMVGSVDYFASPSGAFNVTTALRQPGSSIKPINYAIGIERKLVNPGTVFLDVPTCFSPAGQPKQYCPVNYDGLFHGPVQLRFALGNSFNIPAVKMLGYNGVREFVASSSGFLISSITDADRYGLSATLGGAEVRMTEMAQAYSAFANQGKPKELHSILKITDKNGKTIYEFKDPNFIQDLHKPIKSPNFLAIDGKRILSPETAYLISHILLDNNARVTEFGPSSYLVVSKHAVSVKTGTTDDKKDNWTIGYTPNFLTAVWVGNNDNKPMNPYLASGITGAAPIWNRIMSSVLKAQPDLWPIKTDNIVGAQICNDTGALMNKNPDGTQSCPSRFEYFIKGTEGKQLVNVARTQIPVTKDSDKQAGSPSDPNVEMKEKTVMKDQWSTYCLDCAHDPSPTPKK
jgi:membrane peptidoglycan carboxypeptidase